MIIQHKYSLTPGDYINYYMYVLWDSPEKKKERLKQYTKTILFNGIFIAVLLLSSIYTRSLTSNYTIILIVLAILVLQMFSTRSNVKKRAEAYASDPQNDSIFDETDLTISGAGIEIKTDKALVHYKWDAIIKKQENSDYYFLFISAIQSILIPKRIFSNPAEKAEVEKLFAEKISVEAEVGYLVK